MSESFTEQELEAELRAFKPWGEWQKGDRVYLGKLRVHAKVIDRLQHQGAIAITFQARDRIFVKTLLTREPTAKEDAHEGKDSAP